MTATVVPDALAKAFETVRLAAATGDAQTKLAVLNLAQEITLTAETSSDYIHRVSYGSQEPVLAAIGCERGIFTHLVEAATDMTVEELARKTDIIAALLVRLLRAMAAYRMIDSNAPRTFAANKATEFLTQPFAEGAIKHVLFNCHPGFIGLGPWIAAHVDSVSPKRTPYQMTHDTDRQAWEIANMEYAQAFMQSISDHDTGSKSWLDVFAVQTEAIGQNPDRALFVDIGGGLGHQAIDLRRALPDVGGRCVVQDLEQPVAQAIANQQEAIDSVEFVVHDFFQPQPPIYRDAEIYYLRQIIHDWSEDACIAILGHLRDAMANDSVIIIDEVLLKEHTQGMDGFRVATADIVMLCSFDGAKERTVSEYEELVAKVGGLKVERCARYDERRGNGIVVVVKC